MADLIVYNDSGIKIVTPEPLTGDGGQALTDNFQIIGDHIVGTGSQHNITIVTRRSATGTLTSSDEQQIFSNQNAISEVGFNLPPAASGIELSFVVENMNGLKVFATSNDQIYAGIIVGVSGGFINSSGVGSSITLLAINESSWYTMSQEGIWFINT